MPASSLLALIDDIASILDDVSVLTKVATQKTAGVLGDDLALNAQQVAGVEPKRELAVVLAVAKGSAINKLVLVPTALTIGALAPWAVLPLLAVGGLFLCFEGFEKIVHKLLHSKKEDEEHHTGHLKALAASENDLVNFEKDKIKGAIRTDFILSAEIIVISLGTVASASFTTQLSVLVVMSIIMTIGVYGLVGGIVKLDDLGLHLSKKDLPGSWNVCQRNLGKLILKFAPFLMKSLSILGTAAMFLVGGGILVHATPILERWLHEVEKAAHNLGSVAASLAPLLFNAVTGILAGAIIVIAVSGAKSILKSSKK